MNPSLLLDAGYGLFVEREFQVGDTVSIYLGNINTKFYCEVVYTKFSESQCKVEAILPRPKEYMVMPGSKEIIHLDIEDGGFPDNNLIYLEAHMINDLQLDIPKDDKDIIHPMLGLLTTWHWFPRNQLTLGTKFTATISIFK